MERQKFIQTLALGGTFSMVPFKLSASSSENSAGAEQTNLSSFVQTHSLEGKEKDIYILSNFHPASAGWLANFSTERVYCANSYLDHLDRVDRDPEYRFVLSEVNNMIAIKNFRPARFKDLKKRIHEGRVEAANASFLECTINLSGGEALVKQGVEGLRWQQEVMNVRPRFLWMIDITGMHRQMGQITAGLGLDGLFYSRDNPTQSTMQWLVSPDGSYTLGIASGHYSGWRSVYRTKEPLISKKLQSLEQQVRSRLRYAGHRELTPDGAPYLVLGGSGDYSLAPHYEGYPTEFIQQWKNLYSKQSVKFATPGMYVDQIMSELKRHKIILPVVEAGFPYHQWKSFWIENPKVKQRFRVSENLLQTSEALATVQSFERNITYPTQKFYHAWLQLLLNMDRNTLWGAAGGMVFESEVSWDASDRFNWIDEHMALLQKEYASSEGAGITFFNGCNWDRQEPVILQLSEGNNLKGIDCQQLEDGRVLCIPDVLSVGKTNYEISAEQSKQKNISLPDVIETKYYKAKIDPATGDLTSLVLKSLGNELLDGHANRIVPEVPDEKINFVHHMVNRGKRHELKIPGTHQADIEVARGSVATIVKITSLFLNGQSMERIVRFYHNNRRIDFETTLHNVPNKTVVLAEFPFASQATSIRRGIPYGYAEGSWPNYDPATPGTVDGITPAIRWSDYSFGKGTRVALLDRGLTGREYDGKNALIFLMSTSDTYMGYDNAWLNGEGDHQFEYALFAHEKDRDGSITQKEAFSYNAPILNYQDQKDQNKTSFLKTSSNVIIEALRREDKFIEVRMVEATGNRGEVSITLNLPHQEAYLTNMVGDNDQPLKAENGTYRFQARPQQIITLRFWTSTKVAEIKPLTDWTPLVPRGKQATLHKYKKNLKGHPPAGD